MERKEAIRGAYRMTGGKRRLSGKGAVRDSGAFLRQAAGSAGGNRDSDHDGLSDYAGGGRIGLSGMFMKKQVFSHRPMRRFPV